MGKGTIMKPKFPLLVLLGIVFLASASVSFGLAYWEKENPVSHGKCLQSCNKENDVHRYRACQGRCNLIKNPESEEREEREERQESRQPWRQRGRQEGEEEEERDPRVQPRRRHQEQGRERRQGRREEEEESQREQGRRGSEEQGEEEEEREPRRQRPQSQTEREQERQQRGRGREQEQEEEEGEWRGERRREDPEERERMRMRRQKEERGHHREKTEQHEEREEEQGSRSRSRKSNNPFHFSSNRFQTRYRNRNGQIRVLQRFDQRSSKLQNLQNYRIVEYESRPNTLILPHHSDADYILVVLRGRATITVVNPNDKQAYNLERGDALRLPAGTTVYLLNRDDNQNLRVVKLAIPVNKPGQFDDFFPSSTQNQQSYFRGFSKKTLEVAFNTRYEEIQRILLGDEEQEQEQVEQEQQSQEEGVIVRVSKEQIQELSRHAQSSSRKGKPSKSGPFNLRSNKPIYSNRFGNFYEITPEKNPQLQDLELSLSCVEINEGALMLPHYNSKAIVVVVVNEGKGNLELVGLREQQQQQQQEREEQEEEEEGEEGTRQVQRYRAKLSEGDIFVIPAGHPISVNASSNLHLLGFGINAEDNQRNFLAGEDDNVISQLNRQVKELAFPGSAQDVERLINNQQQSYFANAQPQQREEGRQRRSGPMSSILGAFY